MKKMKIPPQPGTPEFRRLQKAWYDKLKADGFKDLEKVAPDGDMLPNLQSGAVGHLMKKGRDTEAVFHFYSRLRNFLTHNPNWTKDERERAIAHLITEGTSYRKVIKQLNRHPKFKRRKKLLNLFSVHQIVTIFVEKAKVWNAKSARGVDYSADLESDIETVFLKTNFLNSK